MRSYTLRNEAESQLVVAKLDEAFHHGFCDPRLSSKMTDDQHALVTAQPSVHRRIEAALEDARRSDKATSKQ